MLRSGCGDPHLQISRRQTPVNCRLVSDEVADSAIRACAGHAFAKDSPTPAVARLGIDGVLAWSFVRMDASSRASSRLHNREDRLAEPTCPKEAVFLGHIRLLRLTFLLEAAPVAERVPLDRCGLMLRHFDLSVHPKRGGSEICWHYRLLVSRIVYVWIDLYTPLISRRPWRSVQPGVWASSRAASQCSSDVAHLFQQVQGLVVMQVEL